MTQSPQKSPSKPLALLSVTDKAGIVEFARGLAKAGYELLSTGGTAKALVDAGLRVTQVSEYTGSPEVMDGRVKTLHPKIHGGLLCDRNQTAHVDALSDMSGRFIDIVAVNLYAFEKAAIRAQLPLSAAIEHIDIGGPSMLRSAAKNYAHVTVICDPADYSLVLSEILANGRTQVETRQKLATKVFAVTGAYDAAIAAYMQAKSDAAASDHSPLPTALTLQLQQRTPLRYGENPQQQAGLYADANHCDQGLAGITIHQGKELSYNNYLDLNAAAALVRDLLPLPAAAIIKHTNPCGVGVASDGSALSAYRKALAGDPQSAFGGIVALNVAVDEACALAMSELFLECIIAPGFSPGALNALAKKIHLRLVSANFLAQPAAAALTLRSIEGAYLLQEDDRAKFTPDTWRVATQAVPTTEQRQDALFAMQVAKHVKSNAIVLVRNGETLGIGAGQMSRVDALEAAIRKARAFQKELRGAVLGSDAFFPFRDCVDLAAAAGIQCLTQPGGSKRDEESITACNEHGVSMLFTGMRHFRH